MTIEDDNAAISDAIASGVDRGTTRAKVRWTDNRLLIIYLSLAVVVIVMFMSVRASYETCAENNLGNASFNKVLNQQIVNISHSTSLTDVQKKQAIDAYNSVRLSVSDCSRFYEPWR